MIRYNSGRHQPNSPPSQPSPASSVSMGSISPISSPATPRQSDVSSASFHTLPSDEKFSPVVTAIPAHPSTSTISRDSQASVEERLSLPKVPSRPTPLIESPSSTRLPKARVFLHKDNRPDRPKHVASQTGLLERRQFTPITLAKRPGPRKAQEKRSVSDMHDAYKAHELRTERSPSSPPTTWHRPWGDIPENPQSTSRYEQLPKFIPNEEAENWKSVPEFDPCEIEDEPSSKWATSLRHLSNFYRNRDKNPPCIRGSILEVQPPTLTERLGLGVLGAERRHGYPDVPKPQAGRDRMNKRGRGRNGEMRRKTNLETIFRRDDTPAVEIGKDDYVGFLVQEREEKISRPRKNWLKRLLRLGRT